MKKQLVTGFLSLAILSSIVHPLGIAKAETHTQEPLPIVSDCDYEEGTALVTIASPKQTELTKEGAVSFDDKIKVEESIHFGDATPLAETAKEQAFLEEKELYVSKVSSSKYSTKELMSKLSQKAYVVSVEPNYTQYLMDTTSDPFAGKQWHLDGNSEWGTSTGISYSSVKDKARPGSSVIAIMDTGVDSSHEDLSDHMWINTSPSMAGIHGYNFVDQNADCQDDNGHGTHCAGTIAAVSENSTGITGISNAQLMSLKVFDSNGTTDNATIVSALNYLLQAKQAGVNVAAVNCSWGGGTSNTVMADLINKLGSMGTIFVFASGNDTMNHDIDQGAICPYDMYDMNANLRNYLIITGSSDRNDNASYFSDYGSRDVDLFAPGEDILSTYHETTYLAGFYEDSMEEELTFRYFPMDQDTELNSLFHDEQLEISSRIEADLSYVNEVDYLSQSTSGSLRWVLDFGSASRREKSTYIYLDVTDAGLNPEDTHYVSLFMGYDNDYGDVSWEHVVKKSSGAIDSEENRFYLAPDGRMYFKIIGIEADGQATGVSMYYLDDIGISTANPNTNALGKYELMTGTSMAAPMVTGAVGLLAELYPLDDSYNRKLRLISCTRKNSSVQSKCSSGGVLDLRSLDTYVPVITPTNAPSTTPTSPNTTTTKPSSTPQKTTKTSSVRVKKIKIKAKKKTLRAGKKMRLKVKITPTNATKKKVRWKSSKKKWATVSQNGIVKAKKKGIGHTVKITARATDGSGKKATIKIRIKK